MNTVEQYIQYYTKHCSNELSVPVENGKAYHAWLTPDNARAVALIAKEEVIEKACKWLKNFDAYRLCVEGQKDYFIDCFRKAMED